MIYIKYIDQAKETNVTAQSLARSLYRMPVPTWFVPRVHTSSGDLAVVVSLKSSAFSLDQQSKGFRDKIVFKVLDLGFVHFSSSVFLDKIIQICRHLLLDSRNDANLAFGVTLAYILQNVLVTSFGGDLLGICAKLGYIISLIPRVLQNFGTG